MPADNLLLCLLPVKENVASVLLCFNSAGVLVLKFRDHQMLIFFLSPVANYVRRRTKRELGFCDAFREYGGLKQLT